MIELAAAPPWTARVVDATGRSGGQVCVGDVDGRGDGRGATYVVPLGYLACVEPFEMQRFQVIAATLNARLLVVETPGFGYAGSRLLPAERAALWRGDFTVLAERLLGAALSFAGDDPVGVIGYSLGASMGAAMAKVANARSTGTAVDTLVLVEPVALRRRSALGLMAAMWREDRHIQAYLNHTSGVVGAVAPWNRRPGEVLPSQQRGTLLLLGNALCTARLATDTLDAAGKLRRTVIVRGRSSRVSPQSAVTELVASLADRGVPARLVTVTGHHGFWQSLPTVADMAQDVRHALAHR